MKTLNVLDWPSHRYYGETHPLYRWKNELSNHGLQVNFYHRHLDKGLREADYLMIHSRYFENGWQDIRRRSAKNEEELISYLAELKNSAGRLIWFDAADSTGSSDFTLLPYVDVFLKKQLLKDKSYYGNGAAGRDLRIWLNGDTPDAEKLFFEPCPSDQLGKLKLGWNIGLNDYRPFGYKLSRLSNYLGYGLYPLRFTPADSPRQYDLGFRGTINRQGNSRVAAQRNTLITLLNTLRLRVAGGNPLAKALYRAEMRNTKLVVSPYGWGEICYRDFETFISGALLVKPDMGHLETFPDVYLPQQTYVPLRWDLCGAAQVLEQLIDNYTAAAVVAQRGQDVYRKAVSDHEGFIQALKKNIG